MAEKIFPVLLVYVSAASLFAFVLYGVDKHKAKHGKWRVPGKCQTFAMRAPNSSAFLSVSSSGLPFA